MRKCKKCNIEINEDDISFLKKSLIWCNNCYIETYGNNIINELKEYYTQKIYKNKSIKEIEKNKYYKKVRELTSMVDKKMIDGYDENNLLTIDDIKTKKHNFNNSDKLVIDHKISIIYGFNNNIPEEYIADITNLRYIPSYLNQSKSSDIFIDHINEWILKKEKKVL